MDCSLPGSSIPGIFQARVLEWGAIAFSVMQEILVQFLGQEDPLEKGQATHSSILGLPSWLSWLRIHLQCGGTWVQPLGWEDPLEKGKATHPSILAWRIPWTV